MGDREAQPGITAMDRFSRSDAILLAAASLGGYAFAFSYEAGFCAYYRIPLSLISLNLTTGLAAAGAVVLALLSFAVYRFPMGRFWSLAKDDDFRVWGDSLAWAAFMSIIFLRQGWNSFAILVTLLLTTLVFQIRRFRIPVNAEDHPYSLGLIGRKFSPKAHFLASLTILLLVVAYAYGRANAPTEPRYVLHIGRENYIILRIYGEHVIAAPYRVAVKFQKPFFWSTEISTVTLTSGGLRVFTLGGADMNADLSTRSWPILPAAYADRRGFFDWLTYFRDP